MRLFYAVAATLLLTLSPAMACKPNMEWAQRPFMEKLGDAPFLGKVTSFVEPHFEKAGTVTFEVLSSRGTPAVGEATTLPFRDYGTCGKAVYQIGQVWLYTGDGYLTANMQPTPEDLGSDNGADFDALLARINQRLTYEK